MNNKKFNFKKKTTPNNIKRKNERFKSKEKNQENLESKEDKSFQDQIEGRNSVLELLESDKDINGQRFCETIERAL